MPTSGRSLMAMLPLALCAATAAQAAHCDGNTAWGTDLAVLDSVNGPVVVNDFLGACSANAQTASDAVSVAGATISSSTRADFGLLSTHATVATASPADHGVLAFHGSSLGDGYVARSIDVITAVTDTQVRFTTVFDFSGSFSGTSTATSTAFGQIFASGSLGGQSFSDQRNGGPGGSSHQVFSIDIDMPAGTAISLRTSLGAVADGSANGFNLSGAASVDASYALSVQVLNAGGSIVAASGHDYSVSSVPEPGAASLWAGGLALLGLLRRRARPRGLRA